MAVQGHYDGFRLVDVSQPKKPIDTIDYEERAPKNPTGAVPWNQGDIAIYGDILSRSWNSSTGPLGASCDGESVPPGFEGLHIFADPPVFPDGFEGGDWSSYWYNGHIRVGPRLGPPDMAYQRSARHGVLPDAFSDPQSQLFTID